MKVDLPLKIEVPQSSGECRTGLMFRESLDTDSGVLVVFDSILWATVENAVYALLGTIFTGLLAWTAGPRIAPYLGPQISGVASGIGSALTREPRRPQTLDNSPGFRDDEG